jgi:MFS family permease
MKEATTMRRHGIVGEAPAVRYSLDALNIFLADVRDGLGPYLAIYLLVVQNWDEASIGLVLSIGGIAGILAQTPAGAFIDRTRAKRALVIAAAVAVTLASLAIPLLPMFWPVAALQALSGAAAAIFPPAIAAITLGVVGPKAFARRIGRNEAFNHGGNAVSAAIAAGTAYFLGPIVVFWLMAAMAVASIVATLAIPKDAIDHEVARGLDGGEEARSQPSGWRVLLACRPLLIFAACVTLFHFANAAMLPLVGQKLALVNKEVGTSLIAICIVAAQLVMVPVAMVTGAKADVWGRKPIFLVGFAVLAVRGALYPLSDNPYWLVGVQLLDGIGAGVYGALFPLVIADLTRGTGRFNVSQGAIATAHGIGAALSTTAAGFIAVWAGYSAAFLFLAGVAAAGLALFVIAMPETKPDGRDRPAPDSDVAAPMPAE